MTKPAARKPRSKNAPDRRKNAPDARTETPPARTAPTECHADGSGVSKKTGCQVCLVLLAIIFLFVRMTMRNNYEREKEAKLALLPTQSWNYLTLEDNTRSFMDPYTTYFILLPFRFIPDFFPKPKSKMRFDPRRRMWVQDDWLW